MALDITRWLLCLAQSDSNTNQLQILSKFFVSAEYDGSCEDHKAEALANGASDVLVVRK